MRFNKILGTLGAVGIAGALALGTASTAQAAPIEVNSTSYLEGKFVMLYGSSHYYGVDANLDYIPGDNQSLASARARAARVQIPSVGESGPVKVADKCIDRGSVHNAAAYYAVLVACDAGKTTQQFTTTKTGLLSSDALAGYYIAPGGTGKLLINRAVQARAVLTEFTESIVVDKVTAEVVTIDADAKTAVVGGTGEPGATIRVSGPAGMETVTVGANGEWQVTVPGLVEGDNALVVTQTSGTDVQNVNLTATLLPSPIVAPVMAGGAGVAAIAALGTIFLIRRNRATA